MDLWCSGWTRGVVDGPVGCGWACGEVDVPWWSGWARRVVDGPVV